MSFYVPDSWALPFMLTLMFLFFILPIAGLATLGMWFQRKSGGEILRVLGMILGGFAVFVTAGMFIAYLESTFSLPTWSSSVLIPIVMGIVVLLRKRIGDFLINVARR